MDIVMIPFHDYKKWINEGFRTRDAHLYQHFSINTDIERILVINRPVSFAEMLIKRKDWKVNADTIEYSRKGIQLSKMSENTWVLDFFLPDFMKVAIERKAWWYSAFQNKKVINAINDAIKYLHFHNTVFMLQNPMAIGVAEYIKSDVFAFDAIDNWLFHPQMKDKELIKNNYAYVDKNADVIFTVSKDLVNTFVNNTNVHWIPNGVDIDYFRSAISKHVKNKKIIIGYVGKIQDRVDFSLVEKCACTYKDCEFVFLGPVYSQKETVDRLKNTYPNVKFKGDIHYSKLSYEMKKFDIAIIPHIVDSFTNSMNPLKLYEYLAAGKLIVSTKVAGIDNISNYIYSAENSDEFVEDIGKAIQNVENETFDVMQIVQSIPDECTWESRTDNIVKCLKMKLVECK